jgi:hypothetical protein
LVQEMMAEKESFMAQYESIAEQTAVIEQAQKPLLQESNEIKKRIGEFDGRRQEAQVCARAFLVSSYPKRLSLTSRVKLRGPLNND